MMLSYLLKTVLIAGVLTGYYLLFLKNRGFHRFNRVYLLSIPSISFLLPLFRLEWPDLWHSRQGNDPIRILQVVQGEMEQTVTVYANRPISSWFTWQNGLAAISLGVSLFLLVKLLINLNYLRRLARRSVVEKIDGADLCFVEAKGTPFSFFRRIFWHPAMNIQSTEGRQILQHELYHVSAHHSLDILWLESIGIIAWFNPFLYFVRREVIMIHEFMADENAAADPMEYAGLLVKYQAGRLSYSGITHSFFHHPLKRRITMLTKIPFQKNKIAGRLLLLPLLVVLTGLFAFKSSLHHFSLLHPVKKIKIVLDPGHGGVNAGAVVNNLREEDFNLAFAKKIREVAKSYDVDVVLTREGDNTPEPEQTLKSSLEYRAKFAADQHADAFISIHMNSNNGSETEKYSGFQIYVSNKKRGNEQYEQSLKLGSSINASLAKDYKTYTDLMEREKGIYILDQAKVPAVMLECGSMDVKEDMEFMSRPANQEKIARDILEGVMKFTTAGTSYVEPKKVSHGPNTGNDQLADLAETVENSENRTIDTITMAAAKKLDPKQIERMDVTKSPTDNQIMVTMKNGDRHVVIRINEIGLMQDSTPALKKVEVESVYPGGKTAWQKYLMNNLHYPDSAVNNEIQGIVMAEFIVKKDGSIDPRDIQVVSGPPILRAETVRVIKESGKWIPARDHGVAVNSYKLQPISYKLERQDPEKK